MIAYKFLMQGAVSPFTEFRWPALSPGAWVSAPPAAPEDRWIHACRLEDLPYWIDDELWRIELADPLRETEYQVASPRARLVERVDGWNRAMANSFAQACAWHARDLASAALRSRGLREDAESLGTHRELASLRSAGASRAAERFVGYVRDAAAYGSSGQAATAAYIAAALSGEIAGSAAAVRTERAWQARWLADWLSL